MDSQGARSADSGERLRSWQGCVDPRCRRVRRNWNVPTRRWLAYSREYCAARWFTEDAFAGGDGGEGAVVGTERGHGLTDDVLAQDWSENGSSVSATGEGSGS